VTLKGQTRDPNTLRAQYLENYLSYRLQIWCAALYRECLAGAKIIFPESGRGLGYATSTIFGSTVGYPSDSLASCLLISSRPLVITVSGFGGFLLPVFICRQEKSALVSSACLHMKTCIYPSDFSVCGTPNLSYA